jgi:alcohol dehydrogenase
MRAAMFARHGGADVIRVVEDWPEPELDAGGVIVAVEACALNHLDVFVRRGMPGVQTDLPHVSGGDVAGRVIAVGSAAGSWSPGDRVLVDPAVLLPNGSHGALGESVQGGLCERLAVSARQLLPIPDGVDTSVAAALPIAFGTAHRMLFTRGRVTSGETVVVVGASGGVGTACVQLAAGAGARVIAVASSREKLAALRRLGAAESVEARGPEFSAEVWRLTNKQGADVVVDYTGRATWPASIRATRHGGRILTCGATTGFEAVTDLRYVWTREHSIIGSDGWTREDLEELLQLVAARKLTPLIDRTVGLSGVAAAEQALEDRAVLGKIIVDPRLG